MSTTAQMISNTSDSRFLFGTFTTVGDNVIFYGADITGTDLVFDETTGQPIGGVVTQIELQTRDEHNVLEVHGTYSDLSADVALLNNSFRGADKAWYDPAQFFDTALIESKYAQIRDGGAADDTFTGSDRTDVLDSGGDNLSDGKGSDMSVLNTSHDGGQVTISDFDENEDSLYLNTGDVLTQQELYDIFTAGAQQDGRHVVYSDDAGNVMTLLKTNLEDIEVDDFYDIDTEAEEEDLLLGFL